MNNKLIKTLLLVAVLLNGCAAPRMCLNKQDVNLANKKIGIFFVDRELKLSSVNTQAAGLLPMFIDETTDNKFENSLKSSNMDFLYDPFNNYRDRFDSADVVLELVDRELDIKSLKKLSKGRKFSKYDYSKLAINNNLDMVMIIDLRWFGILRTYHRKPRVVSDIRIKLIEPKSGKICWSFKSDKNQDFILVKDQDILENPEETLKKMYKKVMGTVSRYLVM